jgi:hypothetical protein
MLVSKRVTKRVTPLRGKISTPCPAVFSCRGEGKRGAKEKKKRREKEKKEERRKGRVCEKKGKKRRRRGRSGVGVAAYRLLPCGCFALL